MKKYQIMGIILLIALPIYLYIIFFLFTQPTLLFFPFIAIYFTRDMNYMGGIGPAVENINYLVLSINIIIWLIPLIFYLWFLQLNENIKKKWLIYSVGTLFILILISSIIITAKKDLYQFYADPPLYPYLEA